MTRPASVTHAYRALLHALTTIPAGAHVTSDLIADELDAAQVSASEKGAALRSACRMGYLTSLVETANGEWVHASRKSTREARDGGYVALYTRTNAPVPDQHAAQGHVHREVRSA